MARHSVWISAVEGSAKGIATGLEAGLSAINRLPSSGECWVIKLNLAYPQYLPGVVNSPVFVEGLCQWASERGVKIIFIEGDGGNGSYSAQDAFELNGVADLARRYNMQCDSVSKKPWEWRETKVQGRTVRLPYSPFFRRKEYDYFVTAPLFKNHIFTVVSLGMKNLWGCIPDAYRMYYHHLLDAGIVALCKELQPDFSIFDGLIGLRGCGPMDGKPIEMNTVMTSSDVGTGETAALNIMGVSVDKVRHLKLAFDEGLVPQPQQVKWLTDPEPFKRSDFILERTWLNYLSILVGKLPRVQRMIYHSPISPLIYAVVNRMRPNSPQADLVKAKFSNKHSIISIDDR